MMRLLHIELKLYLDDGQVVEGLIGRDGDQRWGNDIPHLAACVEPMEAMATALNEGGYWKPEDNGCRTEGCSGDPDDGDGWNGYCGNCADKLDGEAEDGDDGP